MYCTTLTSSVWLMLCAQPSVSKPELIKTLKALGPVTHADCGDNHSAVVVKNSLYTWGTSLTASKIVYSARKVAMT